MTPFILLALGLVLVFIEFYLPGIILGTIGAILIFASMFLFVQQSESAVAIILYIIGCLAAVALLIKYALWKIPRTKGMFSIYSDKDQQGYQASSYDVSAIGKEGVVLSDLKPGGYILINGAQHQALSQAGYIEKGTKVAVIGGEGESLIVKPLKKDSTS